MVLGGGAQQRHAADVDRLDGVGHRHIGIGHGLLEGVEVDHHQIDRHDRVLVELGEVGSAGPIGQDAAVNPRVEGLDAAAEDLREAGDGRHLVDGDSDLL